MNEKNRTVEEITYDHGAENMSENIMQPAMGLIQNKLKEVKENLNRVNKGKHYRDYLKGDQSYIGAGISDDFKVGYQTFGFNTGKF